MKLRWKTFDYPASQDHEAEYRVSKDFVYELKIENRNNNDITACVNVPHMQSFYNKKFKTIAAAKCWCETKLKSRLLKTCGNRN